MTLRIKKLVERIGGIRYSNIVAEYLITNTHYSKSERRSTSRFVAMEMRGLLDVCFSGRAEKLQEAGGFE
jgi:hypothetical protein